MTNAEQIAAVYLPAGVNALEAVGFAEAVGLLPGVRVVLVADRAGPVVSDGGGVALQAEAGIDDLDAATLLHVPGGRVVPLLTDERTLAWVRRVHAGTRFTTAMCVGRAVLGAAGLLRGVQVAAQPAVPLPDDGAVEVPDRIVADGRIVTGANAASALDLGLHVVGRLADAATARAVQVALEYDVDHWGPPFASRPLPAPTEAEIATLMSLMTAGTRAEIIAELQGAVR